MSQKKRSLRIILSLALVFAMMFSMAPTFAATDPCFEYTHPEEICQCPAPYTCCIENEDCRCEGCPIAHGADPEPVVVAEKIIPASGIQPRLEIRSANAQIIKVGSLYFRDLNFNGTLEPYEDWRLTAEERAANLVSLMTLEEKMGLMLINTMTASNNGTPSASNLGMVTDQHMRNFIERTVHTNGRSPRTVATFFDNVQVVAENTRLGVPVVWSSNARNNNNTSSSSGTGYTAPPEAGTTHTLYPGALGITAAALGMNEIEPGSGFDMVSEYANIAGREWEAGGVRKAYLFMADLQTDPRWQRGFETFGEDTATVSEIMRRLTIGFQGADGGLASNGVALTMKHFPSGGALWNGFDPHYDDGKWFVYRTPNSLDRFHLPSFQATIDAGVESIMPYYAAPNPEMSGEQWIGATYDAMGNRVSGGWLLNAPSRGSTHNEVLMNDLLRDHMGFTGYINTDTGATSGSLRGDADFETLKGNDSFPEGHPNYGATHAAGRMASAINAGSNIISGVSNRNDILGALNNNLLGATFANYATGFVGGSYEKGIALIEESARATIRKHFVMGLFENPYNDLDYIDEFIGNAAHWEQAMDVHHKSVVLLKNEGNVLPLTDDVLAGKKVYVEGFVNDSNASSATSYSNTLTTKVREALAADGVTLTTDPAEADYAFLIAQPITGAYSSGGAAYHVLSLVENKTVSNRNGVNYEENTLRGIGRLQDIATTVRAHGGKVITNLSISFPWEVSAVEEYSDALIGSYDTFMESIIDVVRGRFNPIGRLPTTLPNAAGLVIEEPFRGGREYSVSPNDVPGTLKHLYMGDGTDTQAYVYVDSVGNEYFFGFGLSYEEETTEKVRADVRSDSEVVLGNPVEYIISLSNMEKVLNARIAFEVDGSMLEGRGLELLTNAFTAMDVSEDNNEAIRWTDKGNGIWEGEMMLMNFDVNGFTSSAALDIAKVLFAAKQYGNATFTLTKLEVVGIDSDDVVVFLDSEIGTATATTSVGRSYSIYDLNRDGVVDARDLGIAQRYYMVAEGDANWNAAKVCDFNNDKLIDMLDLIALFLHFD